MPANVVKAQYSDTRQSPNVAFVRPEVNEHRKRWDLVKDCLSGSIQVKRQKTKYLPKPNPTDKSQENVERYNQYLERAMFYNVTSRTLNGLVGQVFSKMPTAAELPTDLEILKDDADGGGVTLDQQSRKALGEVIAFGRSGLLVDYPPVSDIVTKAQADSGDVRPTFTLFSPWDIINWRVITTGGKKRISLVVILEQHVIDDDGFEQQYQATYRVLRLDENGVYQVELWIADTDNQNISATNYVLSAAYTPTDGKGNVWKEIPFTFIGAENNDASVDLSPLYDLAEINIAHYRNSADYEESCFFTGQPTTVVTGLNKSWLDEILKGQITLGSRAAIALPVNATAELLQAAANTMPREAMQDKERQMVALGAKLVEQTTVQRTATEASQDETSETSILASIAHNVSAAYTKALKWAANFTGYDAVDELSYELNTDFVICSLSAQDRAELIAEWQANAITFEEMRDQLRSSGVAYLDDETAKAQMDAAGPNLGLPVHEQAAAQQQASLDAQNAALNAKANADPKNKPPVTK